MPTDVLGGRGRTTHCVRHTVSHTFASSGGFGTGSFFPGFLFQPVVRDRHKHECHEGRGKVDRTTCALRANNEMKSTRYTKL